VDWRRFTEGALIGLVFGIGYLLGSHHAFGRDLGQWGNNDPEISQWYRTLMQPDSPVASCCGESDAYWCDDVFSKRDHLGKVSNWCRITDDRPDAPRRRKHREIGEEHRIPDEKMKWGPNDAQPRKDWTTGNPVELNPTGHAIIFLSSGDYVYCFVGNGGV
jgi:hypothetical protein